MEADLIGELLTGKNGTLLAGCFAVCQLIKMVAPKWASSRIGARFMPVIPVAFGVVAALAGLCSVATWPEKVVVGLLAGTTAGQAFKMGKTTLMGKGIPEKAAPPAPPHA